MDKSEVLKELARIKHNCNQMSDAECLWEDLGMNAPCEWEIPEEV